MTHDNDEKMMGSTSKKTVS